MAKQDEFIDLISDQGFKQLQEADKILQGYKKHISDINSLLKQQGQIKPLASTPSGSVGNTNANNSAAKQANNLANENSRLTARIIDLKKVEAIETAKLRVQASELTKENKKQALEVLGVLDAYQRLSMELNEVRSSSKSLGAEMFNLEIAGRKDTEAYRELEMQFERTQKRVTLLDTGLKKIDTDAGQHQRNVGNYTGAWNGLGNAINQLTREAPAFAVSMQTGFLAISNNLPILSDEIGNLVKANKALQAEGKPTVSVLKSIAGALFSWQTLLSVGVTLLTVYGKEIATWASSLWGANEALKNIEQNQKNLNAAQLEGQKSSVESIQKLNDNLAIAKDAKISDEERAIALKKLRGEYVFYFKDLTDAQILAGDTAKAEESLRAAIEKRAEAQRITDVIVQNKQRLKDIDSETAKVDRLIAARREDYETLKSARNVQQLEQRDKAGQRLYEVENQRTQLVKEQQAILKQNNDYENKRIQLVKDSIGLDDSADKTEAIKLQTAELADFYASQYALRQKNLEDEANIQKILMDSDDISLERRKAAKEEYYKIQAELSKAALAEELRLINYNYDTEVSKLAEQVKKKEITQKNYNSVVYSMTRQRGFDVLLAEENNAEAVREIYRGLQSDLKTLAADTEAAKVDAIISEKDLNLTRSYTGELRKLVEENADYRKIQEAEKAYKLADVDLTQQQLQEEQLRIEAKMAGFKQEEKNSLAYIKLEDDLAKKIKERAAIDNQSALEKAAALEQLQKATEDYIASFNTNALSDFGFKSLEVFTKFGENGKTAFQNLYDNANTNAEKLAVTFNTVTEVFQDTVNFLAQSSQANFDAQYANLEKQYSLDQEFNAKSEEAKAELQRKYEEKRRELRIKEAKAQRQQAVFNIIINTAQASLSAYASQLIPGDPTSLIRAQIAAIITAGLGAAQVALVASQPLPAYKMGTANHPGGDAIVGDGGRSELVYQPSSGWSVTPSTPTVMSLERGSKVFPNANDYRRELPLIDYNGGVSFDYGRMGAEVGRNLPPQFGANFDKRGITAWSGSANARITKHNNRIAGRKNG